jgi:hypothetical protein
MSVKFCQTTRHHNPEDHTLHRHRCEKFESNKLQPLLFLGEKYKVYSLQFLSARLQSRESELINALACSGYRNVQITGFHIKISICFEKLFIQIIQRNILYKDTGSSPRTLDYTPDAGQAVTGLHFSTPREAGLLTYNIMSHENIFLLQGSKIIRLNILSRPRDCDY